MHSLNYCVHIFPTRGDSQRLKKQPTSHLEFLLRVLRSTLHAPRVRVKIPRVGAFIKPSKQTKSSQALVSLSLTDATFSKEPRRDSHQEQDGDEALITEIPDHVDLSVGSVPLPLPAVVRILLGPGGAGLIIPVGIVRGEGIHLFLICFENKLAATLGVVWNQWN